MNTIMRSVGMLWISANVHFVYLFPNLSSLLRFITFDNCENFSFYYFPSQVIDMIGRTFVHIFKGLRDR